MSPGTGQPEVQMPMWQNSDSIISYPGSPSSSQVESRQRVDAIVRPFREWLNFLRSDTPARRALLGHLYGPDPALQAARLRQIVETVELFGRCYGENRSVVITRAPGRINLMGRHVDHRGGYVNMMTIHREIVVVASARQDAWVHLVNLSSQFRDDKFDLSDELPHLREWRSWHDYLESHRVKDFHSTSMGRWSNYVRAGIYRLAHHFPKRRFRGMDVAVGGDVPIGAGLSSSSSLLVASSLACIVINDLQVRPATFVDLCGEGEWFVGTRGGSADHAAMTLARQGKITPIAFFPFRIEEAVEFPPGYCLIVANSGVQARKTRGARDAFNHRVACYELAMALFRKFFPREMENVEHLRDIPDRLGVSLAQFYQMVKRLPQQAGRFLLRQLLQDRSEWLEQVFSTHREPTTYPLRSVFLFGVAECQRSRMFIDLVRRHDLQTIGRLMSVSHDGDRVVKFDHSAAPQLWRYNCDDASLDRLSQMAASDAPRLREAAQLRWQAGGYACSCWEIDEMVDIAMRVEGVAGAQLSGAGMGGCMMVLAREDAVERVTEALNKEYYSARDVQPEVERCCAIAGASALSLNE